MRLSTRVVVYGAQNRIAPSGPSEEQQVVASPMTDPLNIATDGIGNWVLVGEDSLTPKIAYSSNKVDWTVSVSTFLGTPTAITTDTAGNWVAVDDIGNAYTSTDNGATWTIRTTPHAGAMTTTIYHASVDKFYAFSVTTANHMVSTDKGLTWSDLAAPGNNYTTSTTNGTRVFAGGSGSFSYYTDDGITWPQATNGLFQNVRRNWYGADGNWAFSNQAGAIYYSTTGIGAWTSVDPDPSTDYMHCLFYDEGTSRWIAGDIGDRWFESTDLTSWSAITTGDFFGQTSGIQTAADANGYIIIQTDNNLLMGGANGTPEYVEYQEVASPFTASLVCITTDGLGNWVCGGSNAGNTNIAYSTDKLNWTLSASTFGGYIESVTTDKAGNWVALDSTGDPYTSTDNGLTWTLRTSPSSTDTLHLQYNAGAGEFYAIGSTVHMKSSDSGVTWSAMSIPATQYQYGASSATRTVVAGNNGNNKYSDDGITWSDAGQPIATMSSSAYGNGLFVFGRSNGKVYTSATGAGTWTEYDVDIGIATAHSMITYLEHESRWVVCNNSNVWYESTNQCATWTEITSGDFFGTSGTARSNPAVDSNGYAIVLATGNLLVKTGVAP